MNARRSDPWLLACIALVVLSFGYMEWLAFNNWRAGRWYLADVGNIQYCLVNTLHGRFMWSPLVETNHYRYHFTPLLTALAPVTLLSDYPVPLVTVYMLALALCPLPLYKLARTRGLPGSVAVAIGFLFLANHFVGSVQLAYHFETLFVLGMLCVIAFSSRPGVLLFWNSAIATLLVKEDAAAWCACYGIYCWSHKDAVLRDRGKKLFAASCAVLISALLVIAALAHGRENSAAFYLKRAGEIELSGTALSTFTMLVLSTGGVCLLGKRSMILAAVPAVMLLSSYSFTRELKYYYSYPFLPFLFLATVQGARRALEFLSSRVGLRRAQSILGIWFVGCGCVQFFLPTRTDDYKRLPAEVTAHDELRLQVARDVLPAAAPATIQFGLWGITPKRVDAVQLSRENISPERYIFADLKSPYGVPRSDYIEMMRDVMDEVTSGQRRLLFSRDDIFIVSPRHLPSSNAEQ